MTTPANLVSSVLSIGGPTLKYEGSYSIYPGGGLSSISATLSLGTAKASRRIIAFVSSYDGVPHDISTPTLDGTTMTPVVYAGGGRAPAGLYIISKPVGATGTFAWSANSGDADGAVCICYSLNDAVSGIPLFLSSSPNNSSPSVVVTGGDATLAVSYGYDQGGSFALGTFSIPLTTDINLTRALSAHLSPAYPLTIAPGSYSAAYNGGLFIASWR